jgi:FtsP/CotA-like multicopper oxidase with cupredoxin domain
VPVPYPDYPPARITMQPGERQLWRVLNASASPILNLAVLFERAPQPLGIVALDGVPGTNGRRTPTRHLGRSHRDAAGRRAEFIVDAPPSGVQGLLVTRSVDTGQGVRERSESRARIDHRLAADAPRTALDAAHLACAAAGPSLAWLGEVRPARPQIVFLRAARRSARPEQRDGVLLTVDGQTPAPFDPAIDDVPDIVVKQGDVEDWIIENRSTELHAFHIHQIHFLAAWTGPAAGQ